MGFIILFFIAVLGIGVYLIVLNRKHAQASQGEGTGLHDSPAPGPHWYDPPVGKYFESGTKAVRKHGHNLSRAILHRLVIYYRYIRSEFHLFTYLKRKVRAYLYEHDRASRGKTSAFLKHVKENGTGTPLEKKEEISYTQETSEKE